MDPVFITWLALFIWADFVFVMSLLFIPTLRRIATWLGHHSELASFLAYALALTFLVALAAAPITGLMFGYVGFWTGLILVLAMSISSVYFWPVLIGTVAIWISYRLLTTKRPEGSKLAVS